MNPHPVRPTRTHCAPTLRLLLALLAFFALALRSEAARGRPVKSPTGSTFVADNGNLIRGAIISTETGIVPALADVQAIKNHGLNAIHCYAERSDYGYAAGAKYAVVDAVVQMTRDNGLYLVITIGGGGVNASFIDDFWTFYAPRYANETHVIYEIQNEPVVRAPVAASVITMEKNAYTTIRAAAPDTPVLLMSYTIFQNSTGVLADIAALAPTVNWSNAGIAFHGYGENGALSTRACLEAVIAAGYACFQTEFYRWDWGTGDFNLVDAPSLYQDIDQTGDLERLGVSWLTFLSIGRVQDDTRFKNRMDGAGITWSHDFGSWPGTSRGPYGNGGEPRAIGISATTRVEAEDFDLGGAGVASHDTTTGNSGGVDLKPGQQILRFEAVTGGFNINWIEFEPVATGLIANGTYKLINRNSGKAMDVVDASTANGAKIQQWGYSATANQKWVFTHRGANQYTITSSQTGKAIDQAAGQILSGDHVQMYSLNSNSANQRWIPTPTSSGYYRFVNAISGLSLEIDAASTANGARVFQGEYTPGNHEEWLPAAP